MTQFLYVYVYIHISLHVHIENMANVTFHKNLYLSEKYFRVYGDFCFNYFESFWRHGNLVVKMIYHESVWERCKLW